MKPTEFEEEKEGKKKRNGRKRRQDEEEFVDEEVEEDESERNETKKVKCLSFDIESCHDEGRSCILIGFLICEQFYKVEQDDQ